MMRSSVVSGHIRGATNTVPLHVEILYNEYQFAAAFAVASILAFLAIVTLVIKSFIEWRDERAREAAQQIAANDAVVDPPEFLPAAAPAVS